ncbi:MAG: hypothetical protein WCX30_03900 [Candidatus Paceibacterota bacterium]|jgi:hypothetical protein
MNWDYILNSNIPSTLATILAALVALLVYYFQKDDHKKNIAKLILQEIRYAEKQLKIARERGNVFLLTNKLLPTNNWYNNINLFVNDLEETDRDSISDFYSKTSFIDKTVSKISEFKTGQIIKKGVSEDATGTAPVEIGLSADIILKEVADQVELLYNTPAATKLREISAKKWCRLF